MSKGLKKIPDVEIPKEYNILHLEGYWDRVLEIKQENNTLTLPEVWERIENELKSFGMQRYTTWISFKKSYYTLRLKIAKERRKGYQS